MTPPVSSESRLETMIILLLCLFSACVSAEISYDDMKTDTRHGSMGIVDQARRWKQQPDGSTVIPYKIDDSSKSIEGNIEQALADISSYVPCLKFQKITDYTGDMEFIHFLFTESERNKCWSNLGRQEKTRTRINLDPNNSNCQSVSTIKHEVKSIK